MESEPSTPYTIVELKILYAYLPIFIDMFIKVGDFKTLKSVFDGIIVEAKEDFPNLTESVIVSTVRNKMLYDEQHAIVYPHKNPCDVVTAIDSRFLTKLIILALESGTEVSEIDKNIKFFLSDSPEVIKNLTSQDIEDAIDKYY